MDEIIALVPPKQESMGLASIASCNDMAWLDLACLVAVPSDDDDDDDDDDAAVLGAIGVQGLPLG